MKRRNVLLFFALPFLGVFVFFSLSSVLAQADLKRRTEALVRGQLAATAGLLRTTVSRSLDSGAAPTAALDALAAEEGLYFIALLDGDGRVLAWNSHFEGYLPLSLRDGGEDGAGIIDSPAGKIQIAFRMGLRSGAPGFGRTSTSRYPSPFASRAAGIGTTPAWSMPTASATFSVPASSMCPMPTWARCQRPGKL